MAFETSWQAGLETVDSAGTGQSIIPGGASTYVHQVTIYAPSSNAGVVYVGGTNVSATAGFLIAAGGPPLVLKATTGRSGNAGMFDLANVHIDAANTNDGVYYIYETSAPQNNF